MRVILLVLVIGKSDCISVCIVYAAGAVARPTTSGSFGNLLVPGHPGLPHVVDFAVSLSLSLSLSRT
jgi:hypothetical protein